MYELKVACALVEELSNTPLAFRQIIKFDHCYEHSL